MYLILHDNAFDITR